MRRAPGPVGGTPPALVAVIALAWALALAAQLSGNGELLSHDWLLSGELAVGHAFAIHLGAWQAMVAAMMLPTALPLVRMFAAAASGQRHPGAAIAALLGGYAAVWGAFGALAFAADLALHGAFEASATLAATEWAVGGIVLAIAGAFQFTPLKDACLRQCRHPGPFLMHHYRRGPSGGLALGARHGAFCVGCCWALMLIMFAVGIANLLWMALLTAVMVHEKIRPRGRDGVPVTGVALRAAAAILLPYSAYTGGVI